MSGESLTEAEAILVLAEAELAAFLVSAHMMLGYHDAVRIGNLWIDTMMGLKWPDTDHAAFFRAVTILTAVHVVSTQSMTQQLEKIPELLEK